MTPRKCPQCGITIEDDANYSFDENLNLICGNCNKIAFPTSWKANNEVDAALREKKGGWTSPWGKKDVQSSFPEQTTGIGIGTNSRGQNGRIHRLSHRGSQIPNHSAITNDPLDDACDHFPIDIDIDDYGTGLPYYV